ncbi:MAG TPA: ABC transporter permease, partial [Vicinamibacterales bacterium]
NDEIAAHIDLLASEYERGGMSATDARYAARRAFGAVEPMKEVYRDRQTMRWLEDLRRDVRYALRGLRRSPGFALVAVTTLALGIGANTAIVSLLDSVLVRTLPVDQPQQLVFVRTAGVDGVSNAPSYPAFERLRDQASSFVGVAAFATDELRVEIDGVPEQIFGQVASASYFHVLGLTPAAGRLMTPDDEALDPPVAVIGYGYAERRFGGPASALGRTLSFRDRAFTIIGVTRSEFTGLEPGRRVDVTLPITQERALLANPQVRWFNAVARVRTGIAVSRADAEVNAIFQSFLADQGRNVDRLPPQVDRVLLTPASRGRDQLRERFSSPLIALTIVAAMLLLAACANLTGLLLVRGATRGREFAIRLATGAGSARLVRMVLTETTVLFVLGAAAGLPITAFVIRGLTRFVAVGRRPVLLDVPYDWSIALFATVVTFAAACATGLWPAVRAMRTDPHTSLKGNRARPTGSWGAVTGHTLVTGQVALSVSLIVTSALFVQTIANLRRVDLGFPPTGVLTMSLEPDFPRGATPVERERVWRRVLDRVSALPDVRAASLSALTPLSGRNTGAMVTVPGSSPRDIRLNHISDGYFRAYETALLAGRTFESTDVAGAAKVALLNETAAKAAFHGRSPIGEHIAIASAGEYQVVGVVRDHKHLSLREASGPFVFVPVWQGIDALGRLTLTVTSNLGHTTMIRRTVADAVRDVDSGILISDVIGVEEQIDATLVTERLVSMVAMAAAAIVLGLAVIGLYGIVSYSVARRTSEFGVRLALGARRGQVALRVVGEIVAHVAVGIVAGVPLAFAIARVAGVLLFGVTATDSRSYATGVIALVIAACAAASFPAARAARIDPAVSLRQE